jgi:hypothetical protein
MCHVPIAAVKPFKDKREKLCAVVIAYHRHAELTCQPESSRGFGLRTLVVSVCHGTDDPLTTQISDSPAVVAGNDATLETVQSRACNTERVVSATAESPCASSCAAGFAFHTWNLVTADRDP